MKRIKKTKRSSYERFMTDHYVGWISRLAHDHVQEKVKYKMAKFKAEHPPGSFMMFLTGCAFSFALMFIITIAQAM